MYPFQAVEHRHGATTWLGDGARPTGKGVFLGRSRGDLRGFTEPPRLVPGREGGGLEDVGRSAGALGAQWVATPHCFRGLSEGNGANCVSSQDALAQESKAAELWEAVKSSTKPAVFETCIELFPDSSYAARARARGRLEEMMGLNNFLRPVQQRRVRSRRPDLTPPGRPQQRTQ
jgi:hypothetical protein